MRTRLTDYSFTPGTRSISTGIADLTIEDIRLIINETQKKVICSSMQKDNIVSVSDGVITYVNTISVLASGDKLTVEIDQGSSTTTLTPMTELEVTAMVQEITAETEE